ncbi:MAG: hypothetical protein HQ512_08110 [Rhodospirillales bacterium]|nr:hypothetical protein [Rhodospirillales bacterium]
MMEIKTEMIMKLVSKALLSVVMDKSAQDKIEARKKSRPKKAATPAAGAPQPVAVPQAALETEDTHQLIMDSLRAAEQEILGKQTATPERQALIDQALAIQKSKAHVLDDLTQEDREKLFVMAQKALNTPPSAGFQNRVSRRKKQ